MPVFLGFVAVPPISIGLSKNQKGCPGGCPERAAMAKRLSENSVKNLKPAKHGKRKQVMDTLVPGFGVRVTDTGAKSYFVIRKQPGQTSKTRLSIGPVGSLPLPAAREKAKNWLAQISDGKNPKTAEARSKDKAFVQVAEAFIAKRVLGTRKAAEVARDIRREFGGIVDGKATGPWRDRQIDEIEPSDVSEIILKVAKRAPHQARNLLGYCSRLFDWAVAASKIKYSPCSSIKPGTLLGPKESRKRTLLEPELRKVWNAAVAMGYPHGSVYQLLVLSALRLNEVADASWPEFDLSAKTWTIPGERMKNGLPHIVPLTAEMLDLIESLPKLSRGKFLFSTTMGEKPVYISDKVKKRMDALVGFSDWVNHDIRRTFRSTISRFPIEEHVRELMYAHARKGISAVYDRYSYLDEKRAGFELWCAEVQRVVKPPMAALPA
jgi:integrase